ncbi:hypothetical protein HNQ60_001936 [Povalibacter uvarum]|uniref:DUF4124 domain-containing protein n=1 Tax=Povalibacter uvarum TaxID=732238 RepID=A0A841HLH8_9GAMM|nr:DUF4124 domain-containing protein [Povalibacter uvarum]MBB6093058.1 hypothetical protein [Povalibacter uvarum]
MRTTLLLLALLAGPVLAAQTVWKWVDSNGVTHYADRPVPGATRVELATGTSRSDSSTPSYTAPSSSSSESNDPGEGYATLEITSPADDETLVNTGGTATVQVNMQPDLLSGHLIFLQLDGRILQDYPRNTTTFNLREVPRGTHTVVAVITTSTGQRVQSSPPITFHVRQESGAQAPVGPSLRPPPKPQPRAGNKMPTSQPTYAALNPVRTAPIDPKTNKPVVTKPATSKPTPPKAPQGK